MTDIKAHAGDPAAPHHRNVGGGPARAAVFGVSDGLVTNLSLVLGIAGASTTQGIVRLAGLASLVAGCISMASGEWVSMKAQTELLERELQMERVELANRPEFERQELAALYINRGISETLAHQLATEIMLNPETALQVHAREELGVDPDSLGSPWGAAASSFGAFAVGAVIPLFPWLFVGGSAAVIWSVALSAVASLLVGFLLGHFTDRNGVWSGLRQLLIAAVSAGIAFGIGKAVGVQVN